MLEYLQRYSMEIVQKLICSDPNQDIPYVRLIHYYFLKKLQIGRALKVLKIQPIWVFNFFFAFWDRGFL
jgi:hypothetical protein